MPSINLLANILSEVKFNASAARSLLSQFLQRMEEQLSGEMTEYHVFSNIKTRSPTPIPRAPPLAPSPITTQMIGTLSVAMTIRFLAIASPCPRSSASRPGNAPGVSIRHITGMLNFSAIRIKRNALRYPSGLGIPKLRY